METKQERLFLLFALLSASLYGVVAGRLVQGPSPLQYAIFEYSENNQENADYKMTTFFTAMEKFTESVDIKIDSMISQENDLKQNIKETIENLLLKQTTNITLRVTDEIDTLLKAKNTEIVKMVDLKLNDMKDFTRNFLAMLIQSHMNLREEVKELADKITLFTSSVPKEETTTNIKIDGLQNSVESIEMSTEEQFVEKEIKSSEQLNNKPVSTTDDDIKETEFKKYINKFMPIGYQDETEWSRKDYNGIYDEISKESIETTTEDPNTIKDIISKKERSEQAESIRASYTDESKENASYTSLCDLVISSSIENTEDVWEVDRNPKLDDLDLSVIAQTGCTYTGLRNCEPFYTPALAFDGSPFEWRGALRGAENGDIVVQWGSDAGYAFYIGVEGNNKTQFIQRSPWTDLESRPTPGILSPDRYVPFYIRIQEGVMTFGQECESEPMFTYNVNIQPGEPVYVSFYPFTPLGGKHLFHCPPAAGVPTVKE